MICYRLTCLHNNKSYIGITRKNSIEPRLRSHRQHAKNGVGYAIHHAIKKHGFENFKVEIVAHADSWSSLCLIEQEHIALEHPAYNLTAGGEGVVGRSEESRKKSREHLKKVWQQKTPEEIAEHSAKIQALWVDPEYKERQRKAIKDWWTSEDSRVTQLRDNLKKRGVKFKEWFKTPEGVSHCKKMHAAKKTTPELRSTLSVSQKKHWDSLSEEKRAKKLEHVESLCRKNRERGEARRAKRASERVWIIPEATRIKMQEAAQRRKSTAEHKATIAKAVASRAAKRKAKLESECQA